MSRMPRSEELFAFEILRRVLGADVTLHDDGSKRAMVDGLLTMPDGTLGAVEVTTLGRQEALELIGLLAGRTWHVEGARWAWHVWLPETVSVRTFEEYLPPIVLACEAAGVTEPVYLHRTATISPAIRWCLENDVRLHGFEAASAAPGTVWVIPNGGGGGAVDDELTGLVPWLHEEFDREPFRRSVAKLEASGRPERHLFVRLHDSGLPPELVVSMTFEGIPVEPLDPPGGLTGLWLASQWKLPILWWDARVGWRRDEYDQDTA